MTDVNSGINHRWGRAEEENRLRCVLASASARFGLALPGIYVHRAHRIETLSPEERRRIERPIIQQALLRHLGLAESAESPYDPEWLPDGTIRLNATPDSGIHLNLVSAAGFCVCSLGEMRHGMSFIETRKLGQTEWSRLLNSSRQAIVGELLSHEGISLDLAGTQVLVCLEAARGLRGVICDQDKIALELLGHTEDCALFGLALSGGRAERVCVLTALLSGTDGKDRVVAVTAHATPAMDIRRAA